MTPPRFYIPKAENNIKLQLVGAVSAASTTAAFDTGEGDALPVIVRGQATSLGNETTLNDTGGFAGGVVSEGDVIENLTDGSVAVVLSVTSDDSIRTTQLEGGSDNTWQNSDVWAVGCYVGTLTQLNASGLIVKQERVKVTDRASDTITMVRQYGGDASQSFNAGDWFYIMVEKSVTNEARKALGNILMRLDSFYKGTPHYALATGSANAYAISLSRKFASYADIIGLELQVKANFSSSGSCTLNLDGMGAITMKRLGGVTDLTTNDIQNGQIFTVVYDGTYFQLTSPSGVSSTVDVSNILCFTAKDYDPLTAQGYTQPDKTLFYRGTSLFFDDFNRADSNTVGNSWTETDGSDAANNRISTNRYECRLNSGASGSLRISKDHGALTLPVQMYGKITAGGTISRDVWWGFNGSDTAGAAANFTGLRFQQTSASTHSIYANGSSAGTFTWDFSTGTTTYVWLDVFANGSNIDINLYCSTTPTKPTTPTKQLQNIAHSTANTKMVMYGDWNSIGQNVFFDEVGIFQLGVPRGVGINFDASTKESVIFLGVLPSTYNGGAVKARLHWLADSPSTNSVVWGVRAVCLGDNVNLATAFGTPQTVTDANNAQGYMNRTAQTSDITIAGTPAAGKLCAFEVYRDATNGSDNLAVDAALMAVDIYAP